MASSSTLSMLPLDLIREILLRTPAESLVRAKLTCKAWRDIIDDNLNNNQKKTFIYEHLDRSPVRFLRTDQTVQIVDPENGTRSDSPIPYGFQPTSIYSMIHCDGLILCPWNYNESTVSPNLALWNPVIRNIKLVERRPSSRWFGTYHYYGIGYENNYRCDYKILTFASRHYEAPVEIYECKSKSWRTLDDAKVDWDIVDPSCKGVSVKGNMYWLAKKETRTDLSQEKEKKKTKSYIVSFDFTDETFKEICFCHLPYDNNYLGCYDGDKLSLLEQNQNIPSLIEVWVSSKLADGNVSFEQYFKVSSHRIPWLRFFPFYGRSRPVYYITKNNTIIAWYCGYTSLLLSEIDEDGAVNHIRTRGRDYMDDHRGTYHCGYVYVPSLVSLP